MTTATQLAAELRRLGVRAGELLMVHASLRAIGPVEGGAAGVLEALELAVGPDGTLLMILGAGGVWEAVDDADRVKPPPTLTLAEAFDRWSSPVYPEVGYLAEAFRTRPGTRVTDNPGGRFGARGARAEELLADAPWHHYYGPGSPLERFCEADGRVLRLGADENTVTVLHRAEYLASVPGKRRIRRHYAVRGEAGLEVRYVDSLDDDEGIVVCPGEDYFALILRDYLATGRGERGRIGGARSELLEAQDLVEFGARWMEERFGGDGEGIATLSRATSPHPSPEESMPREHPERPEKDTAFPRTTDALGADIKNSEEVLEADALRREDDLRTAIRQERVEESQASTRRFLDENAEQLDEAGSSLEATNRQLRESREDIEALREDVEELRADTLELTDDAESTDPDR